MFEDFHEVCAAFCSNCEDTEELVQYVRLKFFLVLVVKKIRSFLLNSRFKGKISENLKLRFFIENPPRGYGCEPKIFSQMVANSMINLPFILMMSNAILLTPLS